MQLCALFRTSDAAAKSHTLTGPQRSDSQGMAAAATTGMADKERWQMVVGMGAGEIGLFRSVLVRRHVLHSPTQPRQMSKEETAQPAAVASPVDLNDLDSRSSDSRMINTA